VVVVVAQTQDIKHLAVLAVAVHLVLVLLAVLE
jgi:hypothetical protein